MNNTTRSVIEQLEKELDVARNTAAGYADMGDNEGSIYNDGVAAGLARALDIVKKPNSGKLFGWHWE